MIRFLSILFIVLCLSPIILKAQDSISVLDGELVDEIQFDHLNWNDTLSFWDVAPEPIPARIIPLSITASSLYVGSLIGFNEAWYKDYPRSRFHVKDDFGEWENMDKLGHMYGNYLQSVFMIDMFRWTGMSKKKAVLIGGLSGLVYQSVIETLDGFSSEWGWSWSDMAANATGGLLAMGQAYYWDEQRIQIKFSAHLQHYSGIQEEAIERIAGTSTPSRILKDYNGQTYWYCVNPWTFRKEGKWPRWLNLSLGVGADGMFGGYQNKFTDTLGMTHWIDVPRSHQFYFAPDIDLTQIRTRHKALKFVFTVLNIIKIPMPTLEYNTNGGFRLHALYF